MVLFSVDALLVPGNIDTIFDFVFQKNKTIKNFGAIPIVPDRVHPYRMLMFYVPKNRTQTRYFIVDPDMHTSLWLTMHTRYEQ